MKPTVRPAIQTTDAELVQRSREGDPDAFTTLVRRHGRAVTALLRRLVDRPEDVADLLQETLVQAWRDIGKLRDPDRFQAWLLHIARNRCRDYWKAQGRQPVTLEMEYLEITANRYGRACRDLDNPAEVAADALERVPLPARTTAELFYAHGLSVAEIARELQAPEGTVKRRLHEARLQMRRSLGLHKEEKLMSLFTIDGKPQPFPEVRPALRVEPLDEPAPELHWRELRNYFTLLEPQLGDRAMWAIYDPPDWHLANLSDVRAVGQVRLHGVEGLELVEDEYDHERGWQCERHSTFVAASEGRGRWLGHERVVNGVRVVHTFLDPYFEEDWGSFPTTLRDTGRFARQPDGSLAQRHGPDDGDDLSGVLGMARVTVGDRQFDCVHVLQVPPEPTDSDSLMESFVRLDDGRLIACRRYNGRFWGHGNKRYADRGPWDEYLPQAQQLTVDGIVFVHWYDCLGHLALGLRLD